MYNSKKEIFSKVDGAIALAKEYDLEYVKSLSWAGGSSAVLFFSGERWAIEILLTTDIKGHKVEVKLTDKEGSHSKRGVMFARSDVYYALLKNVEIYIQSKF